jgi:hypothetical protein
MRDRLRIFLQITTVMLCSNILRAQCIADSLIYFINNNSIIQDEIRNSFHLKNRIILADSLSYNMIHELSFFRDTLYSHNYTKCNIDSILIFYKDADTLKAYAQELKFCSSNYTLQDNRYNEKKRNLILFMSPLYQISRDTSISICEIMNCTGTYAHMSTLRKANYITVLFFLDKNGKIIQVYTKGGKSYPSNPIMD